jgi:hypothetical protein
MKRFGMLKLSFGATLFMVLLLALSSCISQVSPAGRKQKTMSHFTFLLDNNGPNKQPVYRRYMRYNKKRVNKFRPGPRHGRNQYGLVTPAKEQPAAVASLPGTEARSGRLFKY